MTNQEFLAILNHISDAVKSGIQAIEGGGGGGAPPEPTDAHSTNRLIAEANLKKARMQIDDTLAKLDQTDAVHMQELRGRSESLASFVDFNSGC
jgi:hypothetical protein